MSEKNRAKEKGISYGQKAEPGTTMGEAGDCVQREAGKEVQTFLGKTGNAAVSATEQITEAMFRVMGNCDVVSQSAFPIFRTYFLRSLHSPVIPHAAFAYTKAMYCWDVSETDRNALPSNLERFKTLVKLGGKELMGEEVFDRVYLSLSSSGKREVRKTLQNRKNAKKRCDYFAPCLDACILMMWFPCLLWLMDDNNAVLLLSRLEMTRDGERRKPFPRLTADAYKKARQRLQRKGLQNWKAFYPAAPCEYSEKDGTLTFQRQSGDFDYSITEA